MRCWWSLVALACASCDDLSLASRACPCVAGYVCCARTQLCIAKDALCADVDGGGPGVGGLSFAQPSYDFGPVPLNHASPSILAVLHNDADSEVGPLQLSVGGFGFDLVGDDCGATLAAHGACTAELRLTPASLGVASGTIDARAPGAQAGAALGGEGRTSRHLHVSVQRYAAADTVVAPGLSCVGLDCSGDYVDGAAVTLTPLPDTGSGFGPWAVSECAGGSGDCTLTMNADRGVVAPFHPLVVQLDLDAVFVDGATGQIDVQPPGSACGPNCSLHPWLEQLTLTSRPGRGSHYAGWNGACAALANYNFQCQVTLTAATTRAGAVFSPANIAFVTESTWTMGSLATFSSATLGDPVATADELCTKTAATSGLPAHQYQAYLWLSSGLPPTSRFGPSGWVLPDGRPFFQWLQHFGFPSIPQTWYPPRMTELGTRLGQVQVMTGANGSTCQDWNDASAALNGGVSDPTSNDWQSATQAPCNQAAHLFCFDVTYKVALNVDKAAGRLAFVADGFVPLAGGGVAVADQVCQSAAAAAGYAGNFLAVLATSQASAASRFNLNGAPWVRPDGVMLAPTSAALFATVPDLDAPIVLTADEIVLPRSDVMIGASTPVAVATQSNNCFDWSSNSAGSAVLAGDSSRSTAYYFSGGSAQCSGGAVYCLEE